MEMTWNAEISLLSLEGQVQESWYRDVASLFCRASAVISTCRCRVALANRLNKLSSQCPSIALFPVLHLAVCTIVLNSFSLSMSLLANLILLSVLICSSAVFAQNCGPSYGNQTCVGNNCCTSIRRVHIILCTDPICGAGSQYGWVSHEFILLHSQSPLILDATYAQNAEHLAVCQ